MNTKGNKAYIKAFGEHLRNVRKKQGMTMMDLAYEADMEYSQIAKIERGVINTKISTVQTLSQALGVKTADLFQFTFPPKASR